VATNDPIVYTHDLRKYFPSKEGVVKAVDGVNLSVQRGEIFGFLGPNGAGKTTTLRILTTLLKADAGQATVAGLDVRADPYKVRRHIGYVGQNGGSDRAGTGRENLVLQGRLYDMTAQEAKARADELIKVLDLTDFADRIVGTYSGGQQRRLDVGIGIMNRPDVLFLDEPTVGLDPQNRANLWTQIDKLRASGTTIFLTTHYLEEADVLSDRLAIMDHGVIVAEGTPEALKQQVAGDVVMVGVEDLGDQAARVLTQLKAKEFVRDVTEAPQSLRIYVADGSRVLPDILRFFDQQGVALQTITMSVPTLDDVFLRQTGYSLRDTGAAEGEAK
jgi:ABC-2 type transport system ATP-binding protein